MGVHSHLASSSLSIGTSGDNHSHQSFPLNTMNTNTHPIEFFLACLINLIEFTCYIINEIAGHHQQATAATAPIQATPLWTTIDEQEINALAAKVRASVHVPTKPNTTTSKQATYQRWESQILGLTFRQLQEMTGIKSSKYNKRALQQVALAGVTSYLY